jgi:hypothetical protein
MKRSCCRVIVGGLALVVFGCFGCSDDSKTDPPKDQSVADVTNVKTDKTSTGDQKPMVDLKTALDTTVIADAPPVATILSATNHADGWKEIACTGSGCHPDPVNQQSHHASATVPSCATCHGGNGACKPPSSNHTKQMSCLNCHDSHGGTFTDNAECKTCHFAAAGTVKCVK